MPKLIDPIFASGTKRQTAHQTSQGRWTSADKIDAPRVNCIEMNPRTPISFMAVDGYRIRTSQVWMNPFNQRDR